MRRIERLSLALLTCTAIAAPAAHAQGFQRLQEFLVGAPVSVAADGAVAITVLASHAVAFPDYYVVNALFRTTPTQTAPEGVHIVSAASRGNRVGEGNVLPGMPADDVRQHAYRPFPRGTALVFQLVTLFPRASPAFGSVSTADPAGLTAFVNPGASQLNAQRAVVRPGAHGSVEIGFPGPYGTPDSFEDYPVRIRVSNARLD